MNDQERKEIVILLEKMIVETKSKLVEYEELCKPIAPDVSLGRLTRMDAINNKSVAEAALRTAMRKLGKLEYAKTKIDDPNFGVCSGCGSKINPKRILLMPESDRCVRCAAR